MREKRARRARRLSAGLRRPGRHRLREPADHPYENEGIDIGAVVAVIYQGKLAFGVFGDSGPREIIGEAFYAMAVALGINPDRANGGTADEVVYIAFQGVEARVSPLGDHAAAVELGTRLLEQLVQSNPGR